jgi:hypothetical protein
MTLRLHQVEKPEAQMVPSPVRDHSSRLVNILPAVALYLKFNFNSKSIIRLPDTENLLELHDITLGSPKQRRKELKETTRTKTPVLAIIFRVPMPSVSPYLNPHISG